MIHLLAAEWYRLWKRKLVWAMVLALPLAAFASATYYQGANASVSPDLPQYAVVGNFPVLAIAEMIYFFDLLLIALVATIWTEEIRSGQLRMVFIRTPDFHRIWWAKIGVLLGTVLLFLLLYLGCSYVAGYFLLPHTEQFPLFYRAGQVGVWEGVWYNLQYYGIAFLTLVSFAGFLILMGSICRTVTGALGAGMSFLLFSFMYPYVAGYFIPLIGEEVYQKIFLSSLPMIQWEGIVHLLSDHPIGVGWMTGVLLLYPLFFGLPAMLLLSRQDQWH